MGFWRCYVFLIVFLVGANFRFLPEKVAISNPLVEGWAVLHKSGADEVTKLGKKGELEEVRKYLDANPNKSVDDVAKEIKAAGGYQKWLPNKLLISLKKELRQLLGDQVSANQILSLYRYSPELLPLLRGTVDELKLHKGLSFENKMKLLKNQDYIATYPLRKESLEIIPKDWFNNPKSLDDLWLKTYSPKDQALSKQELIDLKIKKVAEKTQKENTKYDKVTEELVIVLGRADVTKDYVRKITNPVDKTRTFLDDQKWGGWRVIEGGVRLKNYVLNMIQGVEFAKRLRSLNIVVNGKRLEGKVFFNLTSYDVFQTMRAMYSNPNNYINGTALSIPEKFIGRKYSRVGVTDMELANVVRNRDWFNSSQFFVVRDGKTVLLSKQDVLEKYGIKYIGDVVGKK